MKNSASAVPSDDLDRDAGEREDQRCSRRSSRTRARGRARCSCRARSSVQVSCPRVVVLERAHEARDQREDREHDQVERAGAEEQQRLAPPLGGRGEALRLLTTGSESTAVDASGRCRAARYLRWPPRLRTSIHSSFAFLQASAAVDRAAERRRRTAAAAIVISSNVSRDVRDLEDLRLGIRLPRPSSGTGTSCSARDRRRPSCGSGRSGTRRPRTCPTPCEVR